jgi:hypothetical protein
MSAAHGTSNPDRGVRLWPLREDPVQMLTDRDMVLSERRLFVQSQVSVSLLWAASDKEPQ